MVQRNRLEQEQRPTHEEIARLAYLIWEHAGSPQGYDLAYWILAEQELLAQHKREERSLRHWEKATGINLKHDRVRQ